MWDPLSTRALKPGKAAPANSPAAFLGTLQALHLLARASDVAKSQWDPAFNRKEQQGTVVYRGVVYDHTGYTFQFAATVYNAGTSPVQVGTATFADPRAPGQVATELAAWCRRNGVADVHSLIGSIHHR